ncbi:hypothetical protein [Thiorhodococcus minor]|uniref:Glycosyltransferase family 4 protein n=1 Tax=Thiorhodococcus minor TaxID=57489 RepID=A0A6M0K6X6_9GAMM|nr:hypothetical protein [Thiorhodococcus minor]NEV65004.1 hypothetical protein [Thiorhodococcus minor]
MKRLFIADPSLDDLRGHHYGLSVTIADAATELGYKVAILSNRKSTKALLSSPRYSIRPIFSASIYFTDTIKSQKCCGDYLSREFRDFIKTEQVCSRDIVIFHTAIGEVYCGLLRLIESLHDQEASALPEIHLCTPYNEDLMPGNLRGQELCRTITKLSRYSALKGGRIYFWVENYSLVNHYAVRTSVNHPTLHIPLKTDVFAANAAAHGFSKKPLVSYLGAAREEKGFLEVASLLRAYRDDLLTNRRKSSGLRFFVHCVPQKVGYTKKIQDAITEMKFLSEEFDLVLDDQPLSEDRYRELLAESDALFLLYDERYRVRGSGILAEALTMGCRIITNPGTVCARYADASIDCISSEQLMQIRYLYELEDVFVDKGCPKLLTRTLLYQDLHDPFFFLRKIEARPNYESTQASFYTAMFFEVGVCPRMVTLGKLHPLLS